MKRRVAKPVVVVLAFGVLALVVSACAYFKEGSLSASQPGAIGSAHVHFVLCTEPTIGPEPGEPCEPNEENENVQYMIGIAAPPGSVPPASFTAVPISGGGAPIVFTRNDEVATQIAAAPNFQEKLEEEGAPPEVVAAAPGSWPPNGLQGYGYISAPYQETEGATQEWAVDTDFGLPTPADGGAFAGPFSTAIAYGVRSGAAAGQPIRCSNLEGPPAENEAVCVGTSQRAQVGTNDLRVGAPKPATALVGGTASLKFGLNFASSAITQPTFALSGTTTVPKGVVSIPSGSSYVPGPLGADHRATPTASTVQVKVPKGAKPGTYQVTFTATATVPGGGSVSQVAQLKVKKPTLRLGKVKLNKGKGTATLFAKVSDAGTLSVAGKGVAPAKAKAKGPKQLKLTIRAKGKAKGLLSQTGSAKLKLKVTFKPTSGISVKKTKTLVLKLS